MGYAMKANLKIFTWFVEKWELSNTANPLFFGKREAGTLEVPHFVSTCPNCLNFPPIGKPMPELLKSCSLLINQLGGKFRQC